jgi:hypothetical protein
MKKAPWENYKTTVLGAIVKKLYVYDLEKIS